MSLDDGCRRRYNCAGPPGAMNSWPWKMVPVAQGGMLALPCMDHRMTPASASTRNPVSTPDCRTHARRGVKHCSSGNGLRQMIPG